MKSGVPCIQKLVNHDATPSPFLAAISGRRPFQGDAEKRCGRNDELHHWMHAIPLLKRCEVADLHDNRRVTTDPCRYVKPERPGPVLVAALRRYLHREAKSEINFGPLAQSQIVLDQLFANFFGSLAAEKWSRHPPHIQKLKTFKIGGIFFVFSADEALVPESSVSSKTQALDKVGKCAAT